MMSYTVADIARRGLWGKSVPGIMEIVVLLMVVVTFLAFANTQSLKGHIRVQFLTQRLSQQAQATLEVAIYLMVFGFICVMLWQSIDGAYYSWEINEMRFSYIWFPTWIAKLFVPVGLAGLALQLFADTLSALTALAQIRRGQS
jgi:TRAP-type C4-dicarboxylate transport system permease small subunit